MCEIEKPELDQRLISLFKRWKAYAMVHDKEVVEEHFPDIDFVGCFCVYMDTRLRKMVQPEKEDGREATGGPA
jgi:hypothetical protein